MLVKAGEGLSKQVEAWPLAGAGSPEHCNRVPARVRNRCRLGAWCWEGVVLSDGSIYSVKHEAAERKGKGKEYSWFKDKIGT